MLEQGSEGNIVVLKGLEGHNAAVLNGVQSLLFPYVPAMTVFWWCVWTLLFVRFVYRYLFSNTK